MKYIFILLFSLPFISFGQTQCTAAYFHRNVILDKLPVPDYIQKSTDSFRTISNAKLEHTKKTITDSFSNLYQTLKVKKKIKPNASFKTSKTYKKSIKKAETEADNQVIKAKRKWLGKYYAEKFKNAQMEVYDKGKQYKYVFDADTGSYKVTAETCDETDRIFRLIMEAK